jgi:hypothetical protein
MISAIVLAAIGVFTNHLTMISPFFKKLFIFPSAKLYADAMQAFFCVFPNNYILFTNSQNSLEKQKRMTLNLGHIDTYFTIASIINGYPLFVKDV